MTLPLDWIAAAATLAAAQLVAWRRWEGWAVHGVNALLWGYLMYRAQLWGFVALEVVFLGQSLWAIRAWRNQALTQARR